MLSRFHFFGVFAALLLTSCVSSTPVNPSFPVTVDQANKALSDATANPKPLKRPLVIVGGIMDPGFAQLILTRDFKQYMNDDNVIGVSLGFSISEETFRQRIIDAVQEHYPSKDPKFTTEVDVIGYSMGGVAARYAALNPGRKLRINRLFTISSPHRGAIMALKIPIVLAEMQAQMLPGSDFVNAINNTADPNALFPIYSYVCLGDGEVGPQYASPPNQNVWWVSRPILISAHDWAFLDPRIRADIVRRLREEPPLATDPPAPLPKPQTD